MYKRVEAFIEEMKMDNKKNYIERLRCILHKAVSDSVLYEVRGSKNTFKRFGSILVLNRKRIIELAGLVKEMNAVIEKQKKYCGDGMKIFRNYHVINENGNVEMEISCLDGIYFTVHFPRYEFNQIRRTGNMFTEFGMAQVEMLLFAYDPNEFIKFVDFLKER